MLLVTTVWMAFIGFVDDYIKVFKKNKDGLSGKFKVIGQVLLGLFIGVTMMINDDVQVRVPIMEAKTNDYHILDQLIILIIVSVSNGSNLTDGLDGLLAGCAAIIGAAIGVFAYVSGNSITAEYLGILFIPEIGACIGFLWFNAFPAKVFMGDTGSLAIGSIIAVMAIILRKELLIPILCGIFLIENLSVVLQVSYFKYTKKKYGEGKRVFLMSPLHHHYQKKGMHEVTIVTRFWIVCIFLAILAIITLKVR
ncbi:UNVERIFIED_CONTAM: hypothetical protein GTU68_042098 [Idotea baltica]|nr:hypothetical protein [Idotea baltica]